MVRDILSRSVIKMKVHIFLVQDINDKVLKIQDLN